MKNIILILLLASTYTLANISYAGPERTTDNATTSADSWYDEGVNDF